MPDLDPLGRLHNPMGGMIFDPLRMRNDRSMGIPGYGFVFEFNVIIFANNVKHLGFPQWHVLIQWGHSIQIH